MKDMRPKRPAVLRAVTVFMFLAAFAAARGGDAEERDGGTSACECVPATGRAAPAVPQHDEADSREQLIWRETVRKVVDSLASDSLERARKDAVKHCERNTVAGGSCQVVEVESVAAGCVSFYGDSKYDGICVAAGPYVDGRRHGNWTISFPGHVHTEEGPYVAGERHGNWTIHNFLILLGESGPYVDGRRHGCWTKTRGNGRYSTREVGPYVEGRRHGLWTETEWRPLDSGGDGYGDVQERGRYVDGDRHLQSFPCPQTLASHSLFAVFRLQPKDSFAGVFAEFAAGGRE